MNEAVSSRPVPFFPTTRKEMEALGWSRCDILLVSGDAYVDHPSFGIGLIGRHLESLGYRVAVLPQPDWNRAEPFRALGAPRLFVGVSAGAMDSMVNHYTSFKRLRSDDDYSEGGAAGRRPDRALLAYVGRVREALPGVPVVVGGIEASLRRVSHYDFWSDRIRRSILLDAKAEILVHGMGERAVEEIAGRLEAGRDLAGIRGTAVWVDTNRFDPGRYPGALVLPSHEEVAASRDAFLEMTRAVEAEQNPENGRTLVQRADRRVVIVFPPALPLSREELDRLYGLPFSRRPHPRYRLEIPAFSMIRNSLTVVRGCGGGCSFCGLGLHQGRQVQSRSAASVLGEARRLAGDPSFAGTVTDVGGPTANLYGLGCGSPGARRQCRRTSCFFPEICPHFRTDHGEYIDLLRRLRGLPGVKHVFVSSGIRFDVALRDERFIRELAAHHVSGHLKVAPEHFSDAVLRAMRKPPAEVYETFKTRFEAFSSEAGKKQYLLPYLMAAFPGCTLDEMKAAEERLRQEGIRPQQVQAFLPAPMTFASALYWAEKDPGTGKRIHVAKTQEERRNQLGHLLYRQEESKTGRRGKPGAGRRP